MVKGVEEEYIKEKEKFQIDLEYMSRKNALILVSLYFSVFCALSVLGIVVWHLEVTV